MMSAIKFLTYKKPWRRQFFPNGYPYSPQLGCGICLVLQQKKRRFLLDLVCSMWLPFFYNFFASRLSKSCFCRPTEKALCLCLFFFIAVYLKQKGRFFWVSLVSQNFLYFFLFSELNCTPYSNACLPKWKFFWCLDLYFQKIFHPVFFL